MLFQKVTQQRSTMVYVFTIDTSMYRLINVTYHLSCSLCWLCKWLLQKCGQLKQAHYSNWPYCLVGPSALSLPATTSPWFDEVDV